METVMASIQIAGLVALVSLAHWIAATPYNALCAQTGVPRTTLQGTPRNLLESNPVQPHRGRRATHPPTKKAPL